MVIFALGAFLRRTPVVHLDEAGYRVRLIRGAGVREARWKEVEDAVTATARDLPCVVLRLTDGRTTTIPVEALAADRDDFRARPAVPSAAQPGPASARLTLIRQPGLRSL